MACAVDMNSYFRIPPDLRDLNYAKYVDLGDKNITNSVEYNSDNTAQLDVKGIDFIK